LIDTILININATIFIIIIITTIITITAQDGDTAADARRE
jgi:hypothetical protein